MARTIERHEGTGLGRRASCAVCGRRRDDVRWERLPRLDSVHAVCGVCSPSRRGRSTSWARVLAPLLAFAVGGCWSASSSVDAAHVTTDGGGDADPPTGDAGNPPPGDDAGDPPAHDGGTTDAGTIDAGNPPPVDAGTNGTCVGPSTPANCKSCIADGVPCQANGCDNGSGFYCDVSTNTCKPSSMCPLFDGGSSCDGGPLVLHSNGLGQTWQDCTPLGTHDQAEAMAACEAFRATNPPPPSAGDPESAMACDWGANWTGCNWGAVCLDYPIPGMSYPYQHACWVVDMGSGTGAPGTVYVASQGWPQMTYSRCVEDMPQGTWQ